MLLHGLFFAIGDRSYLSRISIGKALKKGVTALKTKRQFFLNAFLLTAVTLLMRTVTVSFNVYVSNRVGAEAKIGRASCRERVWLRV